MQTTIQKENIMKKVLSIVLAMLLVLCSAAMAE